MSRPDKQDVGGWRRLTTHRSRLIAVTVALAVPLTVFSAVTGWDARKAGEDARSAPTTRVPTGERQRVRCWQEGRLIIEEEPVVAAVESFPYPVKWQSADANRARVWLFDMRNATCLVTSVTETPTYRP